MGVMSYRSINALIVSTDIVSRSHQVMTASEATLGDVLAVAGRAIAPAHLRDADVLVTRSTTRVDEALGGARRLRFYGSGVIGTDQLSPEDLHISAIIEKADNRLYQAKQAGRNRYSFFTAELEARSARILHIANALRRALER